ncbi:cuticle protein-like [Malaya genurostris]|uniref:cuticle protein-like n=1 Tax=Malaya genurostris TaxID=325434 RepID=UPI0026F3A189|nr:cuticle protein-like [Malaya genurostris]
MAFKFLTFLALVAVARAGVISAPLSYAAAPAQLAYAAPAQVAYAAPAHVAYAHAPAPISYAAPIAKTIVAAPIAKTIVAAPIAKTIVAAPAEEYDPNPQYSYSYGISDALTGDQKSQQESRNGDIVQGSYSVVDPDGFKRTVDYTSDPHNGFNAVVSREPIAAVKTIAAAPVAKIAIAQPAVYAAPFLTFCALVAVARAGVISAPLSYAAPAQVAYAAPAHVAYAAPVAKTLLAAPVAKTIVAAPAEEYDPNPQYSFSYGISDSLTGDQKSQQESRNGDVVQGSYSVVDPDGTKRTVDYTADPHNGFNAVVHREPLAVKTIATAPVAKVVAAAPVAYAAPVAKTISYAAPVAKLAAHAPVAYAAAPAYAYH